MFKEYQYQKDNTMDIITKDYILFLWKNQSYEVQSFQLEGKTVIVLNIISDSEKKNIKDFLPPFIKIGEDISGKFLFL